MAQGELDGVGRGPEERGQAVHQQLGLVTLGGHPYEYGTDVGGDEVAEHANESRDDLTPRVGVIENRSLYERFRLDRVRLHTFRVGISRGESRITC